MPIDATTGGAIGSVIPGVGTAIGSIAGQIISFLGVKGGTKHLDFNTANGYAQNLKNKVNAEISTYLNNDQGKIVAVGKEFSQAIISYLKNTTDWSYNSTYDSRNQFASDIQTNLNSNPNATAAFPLYYLFLWVYLNEDSATANYYDDIIAKLDKYLVPILKKYGSGVTTIGKQTILNGQGLVGNQGNNSSSTGTLPSFGSSVSTASMGGWIGIVLLVGVASYFFFGKKV